MAIGQDSDGVARAEPEVSRLPAPNHAHALLFYLAGVALLTFMDATIKDVAARYPDMDLSPYGSDRGESPPIRSRE